LWRESRKGEKWEDHGEGRNLDGASNTFRKNAVKLGLENLNKDISEREKRGSAVIL
jgi:hypothetical protein